MFTWLLCESCGLKTASIGSHQLVLHLQFNRTCRQVDIDTAGVEALEGLIRGSRTIFQAGPFWQPVFPRLLIWSCEALRPFVEDGTWDRWCAVQTAFCTQFENGVLLMQSPGVNIQRFHVGNWWLQSRVSAVSSQ